MKKNIIVGISGASGAILGVQMLRELQKFENICTHLIVSDGAVSTLKHECPNECVQNLADFTYDINDLSACMSSGTFLNDGMIVIPSSMKSISAIANGYSQNLLLRAADVCIKEKRKLVLVPRETPLSTIHLKNLTFLSTLQNVYIVPAMMSFYNHLQTSQQMQTHLIGKILSFFDLEVKEFKRWK